MTKTVCFGRFVLEVPATAEVVYGPADVQVGIERYPGKAEKIAELVSQAQERAKNDDLGYKEDEEFFRGKDSYWGKTIDGLVSAQKTVFGVNQSTSYRVESFLPLGVDLFILSTEASTDNDDLSREEGYTVEQRLQRLNGVASTLRLRDEGEVPHEPGVCIDGGFVPGQENARFEKVTLGVRLKEFPDVHFSIESRKIQFPLTSDAYLERRQNEAEDEANAEGKGDWYSSVKFFRRAAREVNDISGYEVAARKPGKDGAPDTHEFHFESAGEPKNAFKPFMDAQLVTGVKSDKAGAVSPGLTDEEAIAVWDKLLGSLRMRSSAPSPAKVSEVPAPVTPLGELAATGRLCPQTGWWQCSEEALPVKGGRKQFIRTGEAMPRVTLLGTPSLFDRLKGDRPEHRIATVWKLVEYEATPARAAGLDESRDKPAELADAGEDAEGRQSGESGPGGEAGSPSQSA